MWNEIVLSLRLAVRARFLTLAGSLLAIVILLLLMAAQFSARHPATVALDVSLSVIRLGLPLLAILLAQELISREFERRYHLTSLTYPRPRTHWLFGRFFAILVLLLGLLMVLGVVVAGGVSFVGMGYDQATKVALGGPWLMTLALVLLDLFVVIAFATLLAVFASTPAFVLIGAIGFVLVARSYSTVIALLGEGVDPIVAKIADQETYTRSLSLLNFILPDLGALDVRMIALYGQWELLPPDLAWYAIGAGTYAVALLIIAAWWLGRREFS